MSEVRPLVLAGNGAVPLAEVTLPAANATPEGLRQLEAILKAHPGNAPLRLHLQLPEGGQVTLAPAASLMVATDENLKQALEAEFGAGCLTLK